MEFVVLLMAQEAHTAGSLNVINVFEFLFVFVCVCEKERERETEGGGGVNVGVET